MQVCVNCLDQLEIKLADELQIAVDLLDHRVDNQRLAASPTGEQIAVRAGCTVEQLTEYHALPPVSAAS